MPPAKVLVLGAGVAGLQAVATAKRLGAIVTGFDIRRAAWEQIASLGGRPLELDFIPDAEGEGGYARPLTEEENQQVREALGENAAKQDVILTTAAIPGRPAPLLITAAAVGGMQPGSVIVDVAAETGGNCELTRVGETVVENGVRVLGPRNLASEMPAPASQLYAKNLENLLGLLITEEGQVKVDFEDDILAAACITAGRGDPQREGGEVTLMTEITIFVLAAFVGFEVISKVPTTLHTPLMSQTNAIHGIVMLGGLIVVGYANDPLEYVIGTIAIAFGTINIVGGFLVTDRMLGMFCQEAEAEGRCRPERRAVIEIALLKPGGSAATALYIVAFSMFILGVKRGTHPTTAKQGQHDRRRRHARSPSRRRCSSTGSATGA